MKWCWATYSISSKAEDLRLKQIHIFVIESVQSTFHHRLLRNAATMYAIPAVVAAFSSTRCMFSSVCSVCHVCRWSWSATAAAKTIEQNFSSRSSWSVKPDERRCPLDVIRARPPSYRRVRLLQCALNPEPRLDLLPWKSRASYRGSWRGLRTLKDLWF